MRFKIGGSQAQVSVSYDRPGDVPNGLHRKTYIEYEGPGGKINVQASCAKEDQFQRRIGRSKALGKLLTALKDSGITKEDRSIVAKVVLFGKSD